MTRRGKRSSKRNRKQRSNQAAYGGQGGYFDKSKKGEITAIGKALRAIGGYGGGLAGPAVGLDPATGTLAGTNFGALISKWLGYGAYKIRVNSVLKPDNTIPMMHKTGQSIIVRHKEFLGDVIGGPSGANFHLKTFEINPGLSGTFPWLAKIASQFQEYTWRGMVFHFVSTTGSYTSINPQLGTVMMHSDYRVTAPTPVNKVELLNEYFASDAKPSECFVHPIECDPRENPYNVQYVRTGPVPMGEDPKTYDLCKLNVATQGLPSNDETVGELWCTYEVELRKPQITSAVGEGDHHFAADASGGGTDTISAAYPFGIVPFKTDNSNIGCTVSGKLITFPRGTVGCFQIVAVHYGAVAGGYGFTSLVPTNCTVKSWWNSSLFDVITANRCCIMAWCMINDPALVAELTFNYGNVSNADKVDIYITRTAWNMQ